MPDQTFNVLVWADIYDKHLELLKEYSPPAFKWIRMDFKNKPVNFRDLLETADCIVTKTDLDEKNYEYASRLKLIQLPISGYDKFDIPKIRSRGIEIANTGGANAVSVAEHVFLLVLSNYRHLLFHHNSVMDGSWVNLKHRNREMYGKTLGIVGLGNVGREIAKRAYGFGMDVMYYDIKRPAAKFESAYNLIYAEFEALLAASDIVTFNVPLTPKTRKMINAESLALMKNGAVLINTSRGEIQDEDEIYRVLADRKLSGAGLDVFLTEPLDRQSPLLTLNNIVLTPHAGPSYETQFRMVESVVKNIVRVYEGQEAQNRVIDYNN